MNTNFSYLLVALLILIIGVPIAYDLELISLPVSMALGVSSVLAIGVSSLRGTGRLFHASIFLAVAGIVLSVLSVASDNDTLHLTSQLALFVFLILATFNAMRQVAVGNDISLNRIVGAVCVYLLLGVMWSIAYSVLEYLQPGSFKGLTDLAMPEWNPDWIYFSFVTITTLGYGDISPLTQTARSLSLAEAIVGQFYIAVLVAGLVSAYISAKQGCSNSD
jgi:uncharacterized membrane protein